MFYVQLEPEEALDNAGKESEEVFGKPTVLSDGKHSKSHPETDYGDEKDKNIVRTEKEMTTGKVLKNRHLTKSIVQHHALNKMLYIDLPKSEVLEKEGETHCFKESEDELQNNFEKLFDPGEVAIGHPSLHIENVENSVNEDEIRKEDIHIKKKNAILQKLLQAEQNYLNDLLKLSFLISEMFQAIDDPNHPIQIPESLKRIQCDDFKNINEICDFHKDILTIGLIVCKDNAIGMRDLFRSRKHMLKDIYGRFCIKLRNCENVLETYQDSYFEPLQRHLNLDNSLQDMLIKPVQMLNRYPLFFRELTNICEKIGEGDNALLYGECQAMSKEVCLNTNDRLAIRSIKNFPKTEDINEFGVLIKRGNILLKQKRTGFASRILNKIRKNSTFCLGSHLFVFKKCVIVCSHKEIEKEWGIEDDFSYIETFWIERMKVKEGRDSEFILIDSESGVKICFDAFSSEDRRIWVAAVNQEILRVTTRNRKDKKFVHISNFGSNSSLTH